MSFSFNFDIQSETKSSHNDDVHSNSTRDGSTKSECKCAQQMIKEAVEHVPPSDPRSLLEDSVTESITIGALPPLLYLNETVFEKTAQERDDDEDILSSTSAQNSDLISGVYEGGLKIWECTYDLLQYLDDEGETFAARRVLDLGCGAGLLGILAFKRGARRVDFQDYNSTVMAQLTVPNVLLNIEDYDDDEEGEKDGGPCPKRKALDKPQRSIGHCGFYSGDWTDYLKLILSKDPVPKYDIIFTCETIYNTDYYPSLHEVFQKLLDQDGVVYLATKSHYFGVGGGLHLFQSFVEKKDVFQMKRLKDFDQGLQRHIVSLRFKNTNGKR